MSSVLPLAAGIVAASERSLLTLGRSVDRNSSGAAFAVRPVLEAQDAEPDVPRPAGPVVLPVDVVQHVTPAEFTAVPPNAAAVYAAVAAAAGQTAQAAPPNADVDAEAFPPPIAVDNAVASSQAAYAYAQMMQGWMESKPPRPAPARRPVKPKVKADAER